MEEKTPENVPSLEAATEASSEPPAIKKAKKEYWQTKELPIGPSQHVTCASQNIGSRLGLTKGAEEKLGKVGGFIEKAEEVVESGIGKVTSFFGARGKWTCYLLENSDSPKTVEGLMEKVPFAKDVERVEAAGIKMQKWKAGDFQFLDFDYTGWNSKCKDYGNVLACAISKK